MHDTGIHASSGEMGEVKVKQMWSGLIFIPFPSLFRDSLMPFANDLNMVQQVYTF